MTYEEAIKIFRRQLEIANKNVADFEKTFKNQKSNYRYDVELYELAISALEKQIPKKPKAIKGDFSIYYDCPYCRQYIATVSDGELCCGKKHIYCPVCGQRLLWDGDTE